jgi:glycosyltransferase involved in cell wall biosynthesis
MDRCIIVVPCYNEAARLDTGAFQQFVAQGHPQRFLLVNDGSTDDTATVLEPAAESTGSTSTICHGWVKQRQSVKAGLSSEEIRFDFWDADLAASGAIWFCNCSGTPRLQMVIGARVKLLGRDIQRWLFATCWDACCRWLL